MVFPCCYAKQLVFLKNTFQPTEINMSSFWMWLQSLQSLLFLGSFPAKSVVKFPIAYVKYSPCKSAWGRQVIPKTPGVLFGDLDCTSTLCLLLWLWPLLVTWWRRFELHSKVCKCKAGCAAALWVSHFSPWKMSVEAVSFRCLFVLFFSLSISPLTIVAPPKWTVSFQNMKQFSPYPEDSLSPQHTHHCSLCTTCQVSKDWLLYFPSLRFSPWEYIMKTSCSLSPSLKHGILYFWGAPFCFLLWITTHPSAVTEC